MSNLFMEFFSKPQIVESLAKGLSQGLKQFPDQGESKLHQISKTIINAMSQTADMREILEESHLKKLLANDGMLELPKKGELAEIHHKKDKGIQIRKIWIEEKGVKKIYVIKAFLKNSIGSTKGKYRQLIDSKKEKYHQSPEERRRIEEVENFVMLEKLKIPGLIKMNPKYNVYKENNIRIPIIVMEAASSSLEIIIKLRRENNLPYTESQILYILREILKPLSKMHEKNIAHCDIKSENIVLVVKNSEGSEFFYKLIDFEGVNKDDNDESIPTFTFFYASPETLSTLWLNSKKYPLNRVKSDIYSLGIVVLEMLDVDIPSIIQDNVDKIWLTRAQEILKKAESLKSDYKILGEILPKMLCINSSERETISSQDLITFLNENADKMSVPKDESRFVEMVAAKMFQKYCKKVNPSQNCSEIKNLLNLLTFAFANLTELITLFQNHLSIGVVQPILTALDEKGGRSKNIIKIISLCMMGISAFNEEKFAEAGVMFEYGFEALKMEEEEDDYANLILTFLRILVYKILNQEEKLTLALFEYDGYLNNHGMEKVCKRQFVDGIKYRQNYLFFFDYYYREFKFMMKFEKSTTKEEATVRTFLKKLNYFLHIYTNIKDLIQTNEIDELMNLLRNFDVMLLLYLYYTYQYDDKFKKAKDLKILFIQGLWEFDEIHWKKIGLSDEKNKKSKKTKTNSLVKAKITLKIILKMNPPPCDNIFYCGIYYNLGELYAKLGAYKSYYREKAYINFRKAIEIYLKLARNKKSLNNYLKDFEDNLNYILERLKEINTREEGFEDEKAEYIIDTTIMIDNIREMIKTIKEIKNNKEYDENFKKVKETIEIKLKDFIEYRAIWENTIFFEIFCDFKPFYTILCEDKRHMEAFELIEEIGKNNIFNENPAAFFQMPNENLLFFEGFMLFNQEKWHFSEYFLRKVLSLCKEEDEFLCLNSHLLLGTIYVKIRIKKKDNAHFLKFYNILAMKLLRKTFEIKEFKNRLDRWIENFNKIGYKLPENERKVKEDLIFLKEKLEEFEKIRENQENLSLFSLKVQCLDKSEEKLSDLGKKWRNLIFYEVYFNLVEIAEFYRENRRNLKYLQFLNRDFALKEAIFAEENISFLDNSLKNKNIFNIIAIMMEDRRIFTRIPIEKQDLFIKSIDVMKKLSEAMDSKENCNKDIEKIFDSTDKNQKFKYFLSRLLYFQILRLNNPQNEGVLEEIKEFLKKNGKAFNQLRNLISLKIYQRIFYYNPVFFYCNFKDKELGFKQVFQNTKSFRIFDFSFLNDDKISEEWIEISKNPSKTAFILVFYFFLDEILIPIPSKYNQIILAKLYFINSEYELARDIYEGILQRYDEEIDWDTLYILKKLSLIETKEKSHQYLMKMIEVGMYLLREKLKFNEDENIVFTKMLMKIEIYLRNMSLLVNVPLPLDSFRNKMASNLKELYESLIKIKRISAYEQKSISVYEIVERCDLSEDFKDIISPENYLLFSQELKMFLLSKGLIKKALELVILELKILGGRFDVNCLLIKAKESFDEIKILEEVLEDLMKSQENKKQLISLKKFLKKLKRLIKKKSLLMKN